MPHIAIIGDTGAGNLLGGRYSVVSQLRGDYIQDASFVRLREVSASYHVPRDLVQRYMRAQTAQFTFGNASRNLLRGPKFASTDLSLMKNVPLGRGVRVTGGQRFAERGHHRRQFARVGVRRDEPGERGQADRVEAVVLAQARDELAVCDVTDFEPRRRDDSSAAPAMNRPSSSVPASVEIAIAPMLIQYGGMRSDGKNRKNV